MSCENVFQERMEEIIAKSKKEKHERQQEKEKTRELTDKLDDEFQDLRYVRQGCNL